MSDDINHLCDLLAIHRGNLAHWRQQAIAHGGLALAPAITRTSLAAERAHVAAVKTRLRQLGKAIADEPGDTADPVVDVDWRRRAEQAEADAAALRAMLDRAHADVCSLHCPTVWRTGTPRPHSERCQAIGAVLAADHPGAALLAELAAARELAGLVRTCEGLPIEVRTALAAYDRAVKGQSDGDL